MSAYQKELFSRAMQAPADVDRVEGDDGAYVSILREGTSARRFEVFGPDGSLDFRTWEFAAANSRPTTYPEDLPFVPDLICTTTESNDRRTASWLAEGAEPDLADLKADLKNMTSGIDVDDEGRPKFAEFLETMRAQVKSGQKPSAAIDDALEAACELLGVEKAELEEIGKRMFAPPPPALAEKLEAAFEQILAQLTKAGWQPGADLATGAGSFDTGAGSFGAGAGAGVSLGLGDARRTLFRTSVAGVGYVVLLDAPHDVTPTPAHASSG